MRTTGWVLVVSLLALFAMIGWLSQPSAAQPGGTGSSRLPDKAGYQAVGRYQLHKAKSQEPGVAEHLIVLDTATGHCWELLPQVSEGTTTFRWVDYGVPPATGPQTAAPR